MSPSPMNPNAVSNPPSKKLSRSLKVATVASFVIAGFLVPAPAHAATVITHSSTPPPLVSLQQGNFTLPAQTFTVKNAAAPIPKIQSFSATPQEVLDQRKREAEAAAQKAVDEETARQAADRVAIEQTTGQSYTAQKATNVIPGQTYAANSIIEAAQQWVGVVPYGNGNHPSDSFACDGFVQYVFKQNGINLPRGANSQAALGTVIPQSEAKAGDLVWWPDQHIGIYDGANGLYDSPTWGKYVQHRVGSLWGNPLFVRL